VAVVHATSGNESDVRATCVKRGGIENGQVSCKNVEMMMDDSMQMNCVACFIVAVLHRVVVGVPDVR
jgi:hypothetical protein